MLRVLDPSGVLAACHAPGGEDAVPDDDDPVGMARFTESFLEGSLPGQSEPEGWSPVRGIRDFALLDDF